MYKIGLGQDSHCFSNLKKDLILGGVKIDDINGLEANSDGDVILHSVCNALSSAIGGDSLSTWADEMCLKKGVQDSREYVKQIVKVVFQKKYQINNLSISIEAKKPYLKPALIKMMKINIARLLMIKTDQIGITFTSGEKLTAFGKGEGIQVLSIVSLISR